MKFLAVPFLPLLGVPLLLAASVIPARAGETSLTIDAAHVKARISSNFYGLMTEEINYSYDGGLYGELVRNRTFQDDPANPVHWNLLQSEGGKASMGLVAGHAIPETALTTCLQLDSRDAAAGRRVGVANDGYWGIPLRPSTQYRASFYAQASFLDRGPLTVSLESADAATTFATAQIPAIGNRWRKYEVTLTTGADCAPSAKNRLVISTEKAGIYWFNQVSLFPPTFNGRPNGNRIDLMEKMVAMKPTFLRCPGGNYLEGDWIDSRFDWKKTLGPVENRPGHPGTWNYRSSDGLGLLEFMEWCEDMNAKPLLAVYAGYSLRGQFVKPGPDLKPFVDEALEEIEYLTGSVKTKWGSRRAQDGHPKPFELMAVEIGNEDWFDRSGSYDGRWAQFHDAIKAKYPRLKLISTISQIGPLTKTRLPDMIDEHYYRNAIQMEEDATHYDRYDRKGPQIFVGEWATREGSPTTNLNAALGDAAWMTGMEHNADVVAGSCYAPLFVNVNPGGMQWPGDLIGYDALNSYGSPSYYLQKLFSENLGDQVLELKTQNVPVTSGKPRPVMFFSVTRAVATGKIFLKTVNTGDTAQAVSINLAGLRQIAPTAAVTTLSSAAPTDTNTINDPVKVVPVMSNASGIASSFSYSFAPYSVTVIAVDAQ